MIKPKYFISSLWFILPLLLMLSSCDKDSVPPADNTSAKPPEVSKGDSTAKLTLTTEELGPFNYTDPKTKKVIGIAIEIVVELMKRARVDYQVQMMPWARAYKQALEDSKTCAFAIYKTPERIPLFKWVGPLLVAKWSFYALSDSNIVINSIDDAKKYTIGGYLADAPTGYLEGQGLVLDKVADNNLNPKKLQSGRIQLWATGDPAGPFMANLLGITNIKSLYTFYKVEMGISCNQGISDELIAKLQTALDALEQDGTAEKIRKKYSTALPAKETVVAVPTEGTNRTSNLTMAFGQDKPPFVFGQEKRGLEIDIVQEALKVKGYTFAIEHMPNNRLQIALLGAKSNMDGVVSVRKKEDGTYYSDDFITFENFAITKKATGIVIKNISDLERLTIVAWQAAYRDLGKEFENLFSPMPPYNSPYFNKQYRELASQENQNKMFWAGRADVIVVDKTIFEFYRKTLSNQFDTSKEVVYYGIFPELTHFQVAFKDKQTRDDFNEGLKYIKEKGIYQKLIDNYINIPSVLYQGFDG